MIFWFKDNSGIPIYSYDGRSSGPPRHLPIKNELGLRLYFRVQTKSSSTRPPALFIRNLKHSDSGFYRCRIDYTSSPTNNSITYLNVIQPPTHLEIRDITFLADQRFLPTSINNSVTSDISYIGPYVEGQNVTIVCAAYGGMPTPEVIWYVGNGILLDSSFESIGGSNYVTNELSITSLQRNHSHDLYTCQASNNNETKPVSHRVNLDVYSKVKHIDMQIPDQMTAGVQYNLLCRAMGAYPSVRMEFWKAEERIGPKYQIKSDAEEVIQHLITFKPEAKDDEAILTCKADNPYISNNFMETAKKLHVKYTPIVFLKFGSTKVVNFSEGESLLLECHTKTNSAIQKISWFHQGKELKQDQSKDIQIKGMTLLLLHLTHYSNGIYICNVTNEIGTGVSNFLNILVAAEPKCESNEKQVLKLKVGGSVNLTCDIIAWPPVTAVYWTLNRSGNSDTLLSSLETRRHDNETHSGRTGLGIPTNERESSTVSKIPCKTSNNSEGNPNPVSLSESSQTCHMIYTISSENDYGTVGCWTQSSFGRQKSPCLFAIQPGDNFDETISDQMGKTYGNNLTESSGNTEMSWKWFSENKERGILFPKLHGTYNIILMGVLIFITVFCLTGFTLWFFMVHDRQRQRTSAAVGTRISDESSAIPLSTTPATTSAPIITVAL